MKAHTTSCDPANEYTLGSVRVEEKGDPTRGPGQRYRYRPSVGKESTGGSVTWGSATRRQEQMIIPPRLWTPCLATEPS